MMATVSLMNRKNFVFYFSISTIAGGLAGKLCTLVNIHPVNSFYTPVLCKIYNCTTLHKHPIGLFSWVYIKSRMVVYFAQNRCMNELAGCIFTSLPTKPPPIMEMET